jgi:hypothetical protein
MINIELSQLQQRLISECPALGERVFVSIPIDELNIEQYESPVAFIYPDTDSSGDNTLQRSVRQRMQSEIIVEIVVRRSAGRYDRFGESDLTALTAARRETFKALVGWSPEGSETPLQHTHGKLKSATALEAHWTDTYYCTNHNTGY